MARQGRKPKATPRETSLDRPRPRALPVRINDEQRPVFSFEYADRSCPFSFAFAPSPSEAVGLFSFICELSLVSWREIRRQQFNSKGARSQARALHHDQAFDNLSADARQRLADLEVDRIADDLFRFRHGNKRRLWGFQVGVNEPTFYVLWWDTEHKVDGS